MSPILGGDLAWRNNGPRVLQRFEATPFTGFGLNDLFIKTCVRAFFGTCCSRLHASRFRVLKLRKSDSRICHLSCIERDVFLGKQVALEIKGRTNGLVSHSSKLFSIL
ncbi:hypothetical protein CEXT_28071 [Caerostris extrusa]|uniref:Uncharacterized protein n=1 Tax=Caerostris extrusa TaxID=172846 RepID=A0AAV4NFL5_CAEEX|nr:hypothetical protein CEXT_28071 [Caerostris extrusa]